MNFVSMAPRLMAVARLIIFLIWAPYRVPFLFGFVLYTREEASLGIGILP